jgi:hypothetical protein
MAASVITLTENAKAGKENHRSEFRTFQNRAFPIVSFLKPEHEESAKSGWAANPPVA